jgi:peptidoglycan hydrolase-like protein with peptidoglycan-binding domain
MAKANKIMKKFAIISVTTLAVLSFVAVFINPVNVQAQTVACPVGYVCTPSTTTSPTTVTPVQTATSTADSCYLFTQNLSIGSTGPDVVALQTWLIANGYNIRSISTKETKKGYFGIQTANALKVYQTKAGIPVTGKLDPITREKINSSCTTVSGISVISPKTGDVYNVTLPTIANFNVDWTSNNIVADYFMLNLNNVYSNAGVALSSGGEIGTNIPIYPTATFYGATYALTDTLISTLVANSNGMTREQLRDGYYVTVAAVKKLDNGYTTEVAVAKSGKFSVFASTTTVSNITVLSPNGGEVYDNNAGIGTNSVINVKYKSTGILGSQLTAYLYSPLNGNIRSISGVADANDSAYLDFILPKGDLVNPGQYKITICSNVPVSGKDLCDSSDDYFTIRGTTRPSITVLSPNGGETYTIGQSVPIKWSAQGFPSDSTLYLELRPNDSNIGSSPLKIGLVKPSAGYYNWQIPSNIIPASYIVEMYKADTYGNIDPYESVKDISDSSFNIISGQTNPLAGMCSGTQYSTNPLGITWVAQVSSGTGSYTYSWSVYNDVTAYTLGSTASSKFSATYATAGTKEAIAKVSDGKTSITLKCSTTIVGEVSKSPIINSVVSPIIVKSDGSMRVQIKGSGFSANNNTIYIGGKAFPAFPSINGMSIELTLSGNGIQRGDVKVYVINNDLPLSSGQSNVVYAKLIDEVVPVAVEISAVVGETTVDGTPVVYKISPASVYKWSLNIGCSSPVTVSQKGGAVCGESTTVAGGSDITWSVWFKNPTITMQTVGIKVIAYDASGNQIGGDGDAVSIPPTPSAPMVIAPVITSLSTNSNYVGNQGVITMYGSGFISNMSANIIFTGNGKTWAVFPNSVTPTTQTFVIPSDLTVGSYQISVKGEGGIMSNSVDFTVVEIPTRTRRMFNDAGSSNAGHTASIWDAVREYFENQ